ncbi:alpha/beta hydrolase [Nocardia sputorum]|uniref:alpha/beta hydrolase n=1 Tax=Nocardia sputorum TaxID=2984338 RepID=UPI002493B9B3|nr:alpha/beta hydrolase [Nocardia sputorum]
MLLHGAWLHASSWQGWSRCLTSRGYAVSAPRWPGEPDTVAATRADPSGWRGLGLAALTAHYARVARSFDTPPVLIGHCVGGLIAQYLLGVNLARAAVALAPIPPGDLTRPVLAWPAVPESPGTPASLSRREFQEFFANAVEASEAAALFDRHVVPMPRRLLGDIGARSEPGQPDLPVDTGNRTRGPLLLVSGQEDLLAPDSMTRAMYKRYGDSVAVSDLAQFADRGHSLVIDSGWPAIADHVLGWLTDHGIRA